MKVKNVRSVKNVATCLLVLDMFVTHLFLPPFRLEEEYVLCTNEEIEYGKTRKLVKKDNHVKYDTTYHRNARNSLDKANYSTKPKDF